MACGTPVVASELPGVADVARLGGLVAKVGDHIDLADRLWHVLEMHDGPRGGELARRIHDEYSWDAVTDRVEAAFRETRSAVHVPGPEAVEVAAS